LLAADEADDAAHVAEVVGVWRGLEAQKLDGALANLDADGDAVARNPGRRSGIAPLRARLRSRAGAC
jgi:hypothetical protein